jgi:streptogramin lyase
MLRAGICFLLASILAACSAGGGGQSTVPTRAPARKLTHVTIRVKVPVKAPAHATPKIRHRMSIASQTQGLLTTVSVSGSTAAPVTTASDISATNTQECTTSGTSRSCTVSVSAPIGDDNFVFQTYDQTPVDGGFSGANQLEAGNATQTVTTGSPATLGITLGGVVSSISLVVTPIALHTLIQSTATLGVYATDADGDAIVGTYVDPLGNDVTLNLSVSPNPNGALTLNPTSLSGPPTSGVAISLNSADAVNNQGAQTITATPSGGSASAATTTLNIVDPTYTAYNDSNLSATGFFDGMTYVAGSGVFYSVHSSNSGGIDEFQLPAKTIQQNALTSGVSGGVAYSPIYTSSFIAGPSGLYYLTGGSLSQLNCYSGCAGGGSGMTVDSSGDLWYGNGTNLVTVNLATPPPDNGQTFSIGATASTGIAIDQESPQRIWLADSSSGNVYYFNTSTQTGNTVVLPSGNANAYDVIVDASGMVWVTDKGAKELVEINPLTLSLTSYNLPYGTPWYIVQDPQQTTTYWYDYQDTNSCIGIGRLDTVTGTLTQADNSSYCGGTIQPGALVENAGIIYFTVDGGGVLEAASP